MMLYFRFRFAIEGTTLLVTVEWSTSNASGATPFLTDTFRHALTDTSVTPDNIYQRVRDRAVEVRRGLALYTDVQSRFGGQQNVWIQAP